MKKSDWKITLQGTGGYNKLVEVGVYKEKFLHNKEYRALIFQILIATKMTGKVFP